jgi:hypothetical protein
MRYGSQALPYLAQHNLSVVAAAALLVGISYALSRLLLRGETPPVAKPK